MFHVADWPWLSYKMDLLISATPNSYKIAPLSIRSRSLPIVRETDLAELQNFDISGRHSTSGRND